MSRSSAHVLRAIAERRADGAVGTIRRIGLAGKFARMTDPPRDVAPLLANLPSRTRLSVAIDRLVRTAMDQDRAQGENADCDGTRDWGSMHWHFSWHVPLSLGCGVDWRVGPRAPLNATCQPRRRGCRFPCGKRPSLPDKDRRSKTWARRGISNRPSFSRAARRSTRRSSGRTRGSRGRCCKPPPAERAPVARRAVAWRPVAQRAVAPPTATSSGRASLVVTACTPRAPTCRSRTRGRSWRQHSRYRAEFVPPRWRSRDQGI